MSRDLPRAKRSMLSGRCARAPISLRSIAKCRELQEGDLLAIMSAGAYGFVMASNYNSRPLPAEAFVHGNKFALIRQRQTFEDLIRGEVSPPF